MDVGSQRPEGRDREDILALNAAMEALNLVENISGITPAKVVFSSVNTLLTTIRVCSPLFYNDLLRVHA